jgi:hypothetical protein
MIVKICWLNILAIFEKDKWTNMDKLSSRFVTSLRSEVLTTEIVLLICTAIFWDTTQCVL